MKARGWARLAVCLLAALPACRSEFDNPFANSNPTVVPPAGSDLIFASNAYASRPGLPREIFAAKPDGSGLTRLTFCNSEAQICDTLEGAPAPDGHRMAVRRVLQDANGDGRLSAEDGESLFFVDLARSVEAELLTRARRVSGVDWSPSGELLVYSALGDGEQEDLWRMDPNGQNILNLTSTSTIRERRPRFSPAGNLAVFERIDETGKGQIFVFQSSVQQFRVTSGGPGEEPLPGTPYVVGSDADPDYSPDGRFVVFRRLTATGNGGLGSWDLLTAASDGSSLNVLATGPLYRGAPDWGERGIIFTEVDPAAGVARLVLIPPEGGQPRVLLSQTGGLDLGYPRWLP